MDPAYKQALLSGLCTATSELCSHHLPPEHEHFSKDIAELNSHIEDTAQLLEHLEKQKEKLEQANAKIQKDIDYMSHHAPLLESKRKQELDALRDRYHKKFEVTECVYTLLVTPKYFNSKNLMSLLRLTCHLIL